MNELLIVLVLFLSLGLVFALYYWSSQSESVLLWCESKIKVEVWYLDEKQDTWKFFNELNLDDWLVANGRLFTEIDREMAEYYVSVNWIAWKDDTSLPKPAELQDETKIVKLDKLDLTGPYGYPLLDDLVHS